MTIKVRQKLVSSKQYEIKAPYSLKPEYITVHNTYNDASAEREVAFMIGNDNEVSFHYAVDDKEVVQGVPANRTCWHTGDSKYGDGNRKSLGVEICYSKSGGERYRKAEALAAKFVAQLLKEHKLGIDRVRTHKSWTEIGVKKGYSHYVKNCPHRILDEGRWNKFLAEVKKELDALNKPVAPPKPVAPAKPSTPSTSKLHTVVKDDTLWDLSRKYKVTVDNLKKWNGLKTDVLMPGSKLKVSAPTPAVTAKYHTVKSGDTISEIAQKYKTTTSKIDQLNPSITNINKIKVGQKIRVA
ncbi:LysM peptidoglycan-binding domain-containing protein [Gottfriedia acidiceleris]|uniref:peptidoglycan recognition protein family protein n=1 Tax=Gottfriedia acidiceleris TaxID=371036 RepID=UPI0033914CBA